MSTTNRPSREITGRHVLIAVILFFGLIITVNAYFITAAVTSFRGEDVKGSYRQGLDYNQRLQARATEQTLGWAVRGNVIEGSVSNLILSLTDKSGAQLKDLAITGRLRHPTDRTLDIPLSFVETSSGIYRTEFNVKAGQWRFVGKAKKDDNIFSFEYDVTVQ